MPLRNQVDAASRRTELRAWFATHPGDHSPAQVLDALGVTDKADRQRWSNTLGELARTGVLTRVRPPGAAPMGPGARYQMPTAQAQP